jgi:Tfp pilus assembly protein PilO
MSKRDRLVLMIAAAVAILVIGWLAVVSPERKKAATLQASVKSAETTLNSARARLAQSQADERKYAAAYASIVSLGEAVPADAEVPTLIYQINHLAGHTHVGFETISSGGSGGGSSSPSASTSTATSGFEQLPFSLTFSGSFFDLYHLMQGMQGLTVSSPSGQVDVNGRLLTISSLSLSGSGGQLTGTISATAYVLRAKESVTGGATPTAPPGASGSASSGSTSAPAVVRAP